MGLRIEAMSYVDQSPAGTGPAAVAALKRGVSDPFLVVGLIPITKCSKH